MSSRFLPNTQGPRWAFKIPFITMEPSRLKSQAKGLGLVSGVAGLEGEWVWDWVFFLL